MKVVFHDHRGETSFDLNDSTAMIANQLQLLQSYRDDGRVPSENLLRDIATYEYIINHINPVGMAELYMETKRKIVDRVPNQLLRNYQVAEYLKWDYWPPKSKEQKK